MMTPRIFESHSTSIESTACDLCFPSRLTIDRISVPDFDVRELRSTFVLRWEFRPGSSAFVIWSHGQSDVVTDGHFDLGHDLRALGNADGEDVVMVKVTYWLGV